jgi:hypothetical protein
MKRPHLFFHKTASGNFLRVEWTPDGLRVDIGHGWMEPEESNVDGVMRVEEFIGPRDQNFLVVPPSWWEGKS